MRTVFFGSPDFAVPILRVLAADGRFDVALVVTQAARGSSPVEAASAELGLPVLKPQTLRSEASRAPIVAAKADLFVVAAFGLIFRQSMLELPRLGCVNVHPSVLPRYRGASPIAATIAMGDSETGVSLMVMDAGIDTGAIISVDPAQVAEDDTTESLGHRLANVGAAQAVRDISRWAEGALNASPQSDGGASLTRTLTKADGWIDWTHAAVDIERQIRAMWPWPRAWTSVGDTTLQVHRALVVDGERGMLLPGTVIGDRKSLIVGTGDGLLELMTVEPASRKPMSAAAYLNGRRTPVLELGTFGAPAPQTPLVVAVPDSLHGDG